MSKRYDEMEDAELIEDEEVRRPLYITQEQLEAIAKTPIFEHIPDWRSLAVIPTEDGVYRKWDDDFFYVSSWENFLKILEKSRRYDDLKK